MQHSTIVYHKMYILQKKYNNKRLQVFCLVHEALVSPVSHQVRYPRDYQDLLYENLGECKQNIKDVLTDSTSVLGGDATLKIRYMKLLEVVSGNGNDEQKGLMSGRSGFVL